MMIFHYTIETIGSLFNSVYFGALDTVLLLGKPKERRKEKAGRGKSSSFYT